MNSNIDYTPVNYVIEHDSFKYNSVCNYLNGNKLTPYRKLNLLQTAKNYYSGSLIEFIELGIDYTDIVIKWNNLIKKIQQL